MKKTLLYAALVASLSSFGITQANAMTVFATQVDSGRAGVAGMGFEAVTGDPTSGSRDNAANALGAPDQVGTSVNFFSLGRQSAAVFGFGTAFDNLASVFEVTFGCSGPQNGNGTCNFTETADLYLFNGVYNPFDGEFNVAELLLAGFVFETSIPNGNANAPGGASVSISGPFTYLALVDTSNQGGDGFDVDAISVSAVPLPAALPLLAGGLGFMGFVGWRRKRKAA